MFDEAALIKNIEDSINASIKRASNKMADKLDNALKQDISFRRYTYNE